MRKAFFLFCILLTVPVFGQHVVTVKDFIEGGTWVLPKPMATDSVDMSGNKLSFVGGAGKEVMFYINNNMYTPARLTVRGAKRYEVLIDGTRQSSAIALEPGHHEVTLRYTLPVGAVDSVCVDIDARHEITCTTSPLRHYTYHDVVDGLRVTMFRKADVPIHTVRLSTCVPVVRSDPVNCLASSGCLALQPGITKTGRATAVSSDAWICILVKTPS